MALNAVQKVLLGCNVRAKLKSANWKHAGVSRCKTLYLNAQTLYLETQTLNSDSEQVGNPVLSFGSSNFPMVRAWWSAVSGAVAA
jgi:hypothetical protein